MTHTVWRKLKGLVNKHNNTLIFTKKSVWSLNAFFITIRLLYIAEIADGK